MDAIKLLDNFVDDQTCDHMIQVYQRLFDGVDKSYDERKLIRNSKNPEIINFLKEYIPKISNCLDNTYYIRDLLLSIYEPGASLEPHIDFTHQSLRESLGILFYFNDNFEGGEIYFSNFDYQYKPVKGSVFIFPCNNPYYKHGVYEVTSGTRYTMPVEITTIKEQSVYEL